MQQERTDWFEAPAVGQHFVDEAGRHWNVRAVIRSPGVDGYYIVRVAFGSTRECTEGVSLLGRGEFTTLHRDGKLRRQSGDHVIV